MRGSTTAYKISDSSVPASTSTAEIKFSVRITGKSRARMASYPSFPMTRPRKNRFKNHRAADQSGNGQPEHGDKRQQCVSQARDGRSPSSSEQPLGAGGADVILVDDFQHLRAHIAGKNRGAGNRRTSVPEWSGARSGPSTETAARRIFETERAHADDGNIERLSP